MEVRSKVWLEADGAYLFGDGMADLLKGVDAYGSIRAAAGALGMSYRQAWGHIRTIERRSGMKMVETVVGGRAGGGARLTTEGERFLRRYEQFRGEVFEAVDRMFRKIFSEEEP